MAQQASPVIAQTLAGVPSLDDVIISLPPVEDVPAPLMFPAFALALEFAYSGSASLRAADVLPLWALAVALQVSGLHMCVYSPMRHTMAAQQPLTGRLDTQLLSMNADLGKLPCEASRIATY